VLSPGFFGGGPCRKPYFTSWNPNRTRSSAPKLVLTKVEGLPVQAGEVVAPVGVDHQPRRIKPLGRAIHDGSQIDESLVLFLDQALETSLDMDQVTMEGWLRWA